MNVKSSLHAIKMLNAPTHRDPSLVPATKDTKEMDGPAQVSLSYHQVVYIICLRMCTIM